MRVISGSTLDQSTVIILYTVITLSLIRLKILLLQVCKRDGVTIIVIVVIITSASLSPTSTISSFGAKVIVFMSICMSGSERPSVRRKRPWWPKSGVSGDTKELTQLESAPLAGIKSEVHQQTSIATQQLVMTIINTKAEENLK